MARTTSRHAAALAKARERRRAMDRDRDARDARIEQRTADALVVLERRSDVQGELDAVTAEFGGVLRDLLAEGLSVEHVAALVDLDATEVRRIDRATGHRRPSGDAKESRLASPVTSSPSTNDGPSPGPASTNTLARAGG